MSTQLNKIEAILQATVETLREVGLSGFELQLHIFDHYEEAQAWRDLAPAAHASSYYLRVAKDDNDTDSLGKSHGRTADGQWTVTMYLPAGFVPASQKETLQADLNHKIKLQEIINV